jgi:hypothetical protein
MSSGRPSRAHAVTPESLPPAQLVQLYCSTFSCWDGGKLSAPRFIQLQVASQAQDRTCRRENGPNNSRVEASEPEVQPLVDKAFCEGDLTITSFDGVKFVVQSFYLKATR